jgi:hypothetical protein
MNTRVVINADESIVLWEQNTPTGHTYIRMDLDVYNNLSSITFTSESQIDRLILELKALKVKIR